MQRIGSLNERRKWFSELRCCDQNGKVARGFQRPRFFNMSGPNFVPVLVLKVLEEVWDWNFFHFTWPIQYLFEGLLFSRLQSESSIWFLCSRMLERSTANNCNAISLFSIVFVLLFSLERGFLRQLYLIELSWLLGFTDLEVRLSTLSLHFLVMVWF